MKNKKKLLALLSRAYAYTPPVQNQQKLIADIFLYSHRK